MWIDIKLNQPVSGKRVDIWRVPSIGYPVSTGYRVCNQYYGKSALSADIERITHWMPIPEPPTANAVEAGATEAAGEPSAVQHAQLAIAALRSALSTLPVNLGMVDQIIVAFELELQQHAGA
jgi:hypothetical protein